MLIDKTAAPAINDIVGFRLTTGEEVIGKLAAITPDSYAISKPMGVAVQRVGDDKAQLAFMPVMFSVDDTGILHFISTGMAVRPSKVRPNIAASYTQRTSGLAMPTPDQTSRFQAP